MVRVDGMAGEGSLIHIRGLEKDYRRGGEEIHVLQGLNLDVEKGEFVAFMGPSGSGKTTLLNLLGGLDTPSQGTISVARRRVVIVLLLGRFYGDVHMELWKWFAVGGTIWVGSWTFTALAVAIGYRFMPDSVQPIAMFVYFLMSILGGLWFALTGFLEKIGRVLPTYQITRIGTDLISNQSVPATAYITILAWFAGFVMLAVLAVRGTAETV